MNNNGKAMKTALVRFHEDSLRLTVTLTDTGKKLRWYKVSAMLNWCARNGYAPYVDDCKEPQSLQDNNKQSQKHQ